MADIAIKDRTLVVTLKGWHKLWALKSEVSAPLANVTGVEIDPEIASRPTGFRMPGSRVPGLITAGSYRGRHGWDFWDVRRPAKAIVIHLKDERYQRLIVEVDDPEATVRTIQQALPASPVSPQAGS
ncbi:MAG: hypothetical protein ACRDJH_03065 [Thermomicrobiales bacterium]